LNIALGWQKIEEDVRLVLDNSLEKSHWGANSAPPDFLTVFWGRGKEGKRGDEREKGGGKERARTKGEKEKFKGEKEEERKRKRREGREEEGKEETGRKMEGIMCAVHD